MFYRAVVVVYGFYVVVTSLKEQKEKHRPYQGSGDYQG
jgi:hypothetical protein